DGRRKVGSKVTCEVPVKGAPDKKPRYQPDQQTRILPRCSWDTPRTGPHLGSMPILPRQNLLLSLWQNPLEKERCRHASNVLRLGAAPKQRLQLREWWLHPRNPRAAMAIRSASS